MEFAHAPTELTTAATDLLLAVECVVIAVWFAPRPYADRFRAVLWYWVFGLTATASLLGAIAHGFAFSEPVLSRLWMPLYLSLGMVVALFVVGAIHDWCGRLLAMRLVPWALATGMAFFAITQLRDEAFTIFVLYEAAAMVSAFAIYVVLVLKQRLPGAGRVAAAIALNLAAAAVQASSLKLNFIVPLDHNGLFHVIQILAVAVLGAGLRAGFLGNRLTR
jgi:hypothetical protein